MYPRLRFFALAAVLALVGPLGLTGCGQATTNLITGEQTRGAYTWQQEVELGREADQQVIAQFGLYDDQALQNYVNQLGQEVLRTSAHGQQETPAEIRNTPFHFRVLDSEVPNAMALPGGYIYVTRGLLAHLDNEAQLAVVLGHEIGHVLGRHASQRAANAQTGQIGLLGAAILGGVVGGGRVAEGILNYGGAGVQILFLSHSRDAEREADQAGVAYASFAGYDAAEAARFFGSLSRLGQQSGSGGIPSFLSTHPDPGEREQTIPQLAAQYDSATETNGPQYLAQIDGIVLGQNPRQGFVEDGRFFHPDLRFQFAFPQGWQLVNGAAAVQIGEPNGRAVMEFTFAQGSSAQEAARAFAGQQGFQVSNQQSTTVNGNRAYAVSGSANTQQGQLGVLAYFIEHGGNVYRFMGLTAANSFGQYGNTFESTFRSFEQLTSASHLNRQPVRLDVVQASRAGTFQSFLSGRPTPPQMSMNELAILNYVDLNTQIPAGASLKLPAN